MRISRTSAWVALVAAAALVTTGATAHASSHREAPSISEDPVADNTDLYAFVDPLDATKVDIIATWIPFEEPAGGPLFYKFGDQVRYDIDIDNNGDGEEDIVYQFTFTTPADATLAQQTFSVFKQQKKLKHGNLFLGEGLTTPPVNVGPRSTPNYALLADAAVHTLPGDITVFAGQRADAFFYDQGAFYDLLGLRPFGNVHSIPLPASVARNSLKGFNVHAIAMQIPKSLLVGSDPVIGIWSTTYRRKSRSLSKKGLKHGGGWAQVSRLGMPFVNELIIPRSQKDLFNVSKPKDDAQFVPFIQDPETARAIAANYPVFTCYPTAPRTDLTTFFLTGIPGVNQQATTRPSDMLRLDTSVEPSLIGNRQSLGLLAGQLDGFPNGRRLEDDVADIVLRAFMGGTPYGACSGQGANELLSDGVGAPAAPLLNHFPYLPTPYQGYDHTH